MSEINVINRRSTLRNFAKLIIAGSIATSIYAGWNHVSQIAGTAKEKLDSTAQYVVTGTKNTVTDIKQNNLREDDLKYVNEHNYFEGKKKLDADKKDLNPQTTQELEKILSQKHPDALYSKAIRENNPENKTWQLVEAFKQYQLIGDKSKTENIRQLYFQTKLDMVADMIRKARDGDSGISPILEKLVNDQFIFYEGKSLANFNTEQNRETILGMLSSEKDYIHRVSETSSSYVTENLLAFGNIASHTVRIMTYVMKSPAENSDQTTQDMTRLDDNTIQKFKISTIDTYAIILKSKEKDMILSSRLTAFAGLRRLERKFDQVNKYFNTEEELLKIILDQ